MLFGCRERRSTRAPWIGLTGDEASTGLDGIETIRAIDKKQAASIAVWDEQACTLLVMQVAVHPDGSVESLFRVEHIITVRVDRNSSKVIGYCHMI